MADEPLSQAEVECLLSALSPEAEGKGPGAGGPQLLSLQHSRVTAYDFKRPEPVDKEQIRAIQKLHDGFGRDYGAALSALLRHQVGIKLTSVDQLTYSEFVFSLANPTCFNIVRAVSPPASLILDITPTIVFPIIDRLLGGGVVGGVPSRRPLTEIETRLVSRITSPLLRELEKAWAGVTKLDLEVDRVESNPQIVSVAPPNDVVVVVSFELTLAAHRGMFNLCWPFSFIQPFAHRLTRTTWTERDEASTSDSAGAEAVLASAENRELRRRLNGSRLQVVAMLAQQKISMMDLLDLKVGDMIATDKEVAAPLVVEVAGHSKFQGQVGAYKGRKAIQIQDVLASGRAERTAPPLSGAHPPAAPG